MPDGDWVEAQEWAEETWGKAELGDQRSTQRVVRLAGQMAAKPDRHLPEQCDQWADLKAAYRFLNNPAIDPLQLSRPVWQATLARARQAHSTVLFIQDGSDLDFTHHPHTRGLGYGGNELQRGLKLQTMLSVLPGGERQKLSVLGIAAQHGWIRTEIRRREPRRQRYERWNEGDVWADLLKAAGTPPPQSRWVCVSDRGSDDYGYFLEAREQGWYLLARAARTRRALLDGREVSLFEAVRAQPVAAQGMLYLRGREGRAAQHLALNVSFTAITLRPPKNGPHRWVIEEYHKALKTGCKLEERQLQSADAIQRLVSLLAPMAARLLELRSLSRTAGNEPAQAHFPLPLVELVLRRAKLRQSPKTCTLYEFWRGVAQLGGFIGRKSDGEPGWQTLWSGWLRVLDMAWGAGIDLSDGEF